MTYKLTYFNMTGRAEQIRFLLAYLNMDFEDHRLEANKWMSIKPSEFLEHLYGIYHWSTVD